MKELSEEDKKAFEWLKKRFGKFYDLCCTPLKRETKTKIILADTENNKLLMNEFRNSYLPQRADFEGWKYNPENFIVEYVDEGLLPQRMTVLANPHKENVGFEEFQPESGIFIRLREKEADKIVDNLRDILLTSDDTLDYSI